MTSIFLTAIVQTALMATGVEAKPVSVETYAKAREIVTETGKPLMVMVGADWCGPCQTMKKKILPSVLQGGLLRKVVFTVVNTDREQELAEQLTGGGPIPQLVMFHKKGNGWIRKKLVGGQSAETVEKFIKEGMGGEEDSKASATSSNDDDSNGAEDAGDEELPENNQTTQRQNIIADENESKRG